MKNNYRMFCLATCLAGMLNSAHAGIPDALSKHYESEPIQEHAITLRAPEVAEEGKVVPVSIGRISLPGKDLHVTEVSIYSGNNLNCPVSTYKLSPSAMAEGLAGRMRLAKSTTVHAIARLSDGSLISGEKNIKVTIGGCGGGGTGSSASSSVGNYCKNQNSVKQ